MDFTIHLNGLQSEFYNALSEGFDDEEKEKDGIFEIIKFDEHITQQVVDTFNNQEYYPQHMEGIVRLYNYLMIDLKHIYKFCNYGIYKDILEWKIPKCMKTNELNIDNMNEYAEYGLLKFMKYAHRNDCPWDGEIYSSAAKNGHLDCIKYAHENGCPWNEDTCTYAAENGHLECLKYTHENGCPWDEYTCLEAAGNGHLNCLKYAHENGCPWDVATCINATRYKKLECLKYARENGCPWNESTCKNAVENVHLDCFNYAYEMLCLS